MLKQYDDYIFFSLTFSLMDLYFFVHKSLIVHFTSIKSIPPLALHAYRRPPKLLTGRQNIHVSISYTPRSIFTGSLN